jgi:hypothetical protein
MKDTTYPFAGAGNTRSSSTWQAASSTTIIDPYFTRYCRWPSITVEGVQSCSAMTREGRGNNTFEILVFLLFLSLSLSSFRPSLFFERREGGKERIADRAKRMLWYARETTSFNNPIVSQPRGKSGWALSDAVRGLVNYVYMPPLLLAHCASYNSMRYRTCIPNAPLDG